MTLGGGYRIREVPDNRLVSGGQHQGVSARQVSVIQRKRRQQFADGVRT